ncbi:MAG: MarC family protein [Infirmifilum sp.]
MDGGWLLDVVLMTAQLYAVLNPVSVLPTFASLVGGLGQAEKAEAVKKASVYVLTLMVVFAVSGGVLLSFLNVSIASLRFGGGVLLMVIAIDMLSGISRTKMLENTEESLIVPIATPLLVGPGTMTTLVVLTATHGLLKTLPATVAAALLVYLTLRFGDLLLEVAGKNVVRSMGRFMAVIIASISAEMIHSALLEWGLFYR